MSQVDQKRAFNKLKHDLEGWRELIVLTNSFLKWEKKFYPGVIFGMVSLVFMVLWYMDLSTLTLVSLGGLLAVIFDYGYGIVARFLFNPENWSGVMENQFEEVCNEICSTKMKLCSWYTFLFTAKEQKSTMFLIIVSVVLLGLAWIGAVIDNLLLTYLLTLCVALYPGLHHHGFINTVKNQFGSLVSSKINQLKEKASKTE